MDAEQSLKVVNTQPKRRALVLYGKLGGAHVAASASIQSALKDSYDIQLYEPLGAFYGNMFKDFMKNGSWQIWPLVRMQWICEAMVRDDYLLRDTFRADLTKQIEDFKPDVILSNFPIGNFLVYQLAKKRRIPVVFIPVDLHYDRYFYFWYLSRHPNPKKFMVSLHFDDNKIKGSLLRN